MYPMRVTSLMPLAWSFDGQALDGTVGVAKLSSMAVVIWCFWFFDEDNIAG